MEDDETGKLIANERAKLVATYLNGLAVGLFIVGGVAPVFTYIFADVALRPSLTSIVFGSLICQFVSAGLHYAARRPLGGLKP